MLLTDFELQNWVLFLRWFDKSTIIEISKTERNELDKIKLLFVIAALVAKVFLSPFLIFR